MTKTIPYNPTEEKQLFREKHGVNTAMLDRTLINLNSLHLSVKHRDQFQYICLSKATRNGTRNSNIAMESHFSKEDSWSREQVGKELVR